MSQKTSEQKPADSCNATLSRDHQSVGEEIANSITHGIGILLSITALVLLLVFNPTNRNAWQITSFSIYGGTLIFLYLVSTLYHSFHGRTKSILRRLDHAAIYLLIAGTYTPVTLILMRHSGWGWALFGVIWTMAIAGVVFKLLFFGRWRLVSVLFYLAMGWLVVIAAKPLVTVSPPGLILWLLIGGVCYTLSVIFYGWRKLPYHHTVFHLLILAGSFSHFFGLLRYLT